MVVTVRTRCGQSPTEGDTFTRYENDALSAQLPPVNGAAWAPFVGVTPESTEGTDWKVSVYVTADTQEEACMRGLAAFNELPCFNRDWERIYASAIMVGMSSRRWHVVILRQETPMTVVERTSYTALEPFVDLVANVNYADITLDSLLQLIWSACLDMKFATQPLNKIQRALALYAMDEAEDCGTPGAMAAAALWSLFFSDALPYDERTEAIREDLVRYRDSDAEASQDNFSGLYFEWQDMTVRSVIKTVDVGIIQPGETAAEAARDRDLYKAEEPDQVVMALNVGITFESAAGWTLNGDTLVNGTGYGTTTFSCSQESLLAVINSALREYLEQGPLNVVEVVQS